MSRGSVSVRVPATSANLGPGFDALGLALSLHDVVTAEVLDVPGGAGAASVVEVEGEGAGSVALDEGHLVLACVLRGLRELGLPAEALPRLRLHCRNAIPHGRGLGSSSAAIVAGLWLARALVDRGQVPLPIPGSARPFDDRRLLSLAAAIEGHPDNVAPAVLGGLTVAWTEGASGADHRFAAARAEVLAGLRAVAFVPPAPLETVVARGLLPSTVPFRDAAQNAGRAALLVAALTGTAGRDAGLAGVLLAATADRLHQQYRAPAMPDSSALLAALRADSAPAAISGAGPTVLAFAGLTGLPDSAELVARAPGGWRALVLDVDPHGAVST